MSILTRIGHRLTAMHGGGIGCVSRKHQHHIRCLHFSSTSIAYNIDHQQSPHHPPRNEHQRQKLHIGFASLSTSLPFSPESEYTSNGNGNKQLVGDTELDPHASIMLTSLRGGVTNFDTPAPPLIESNKVLPSSGADSKTCWNANRQSEIQIANALDQAWDFLVDEDDSEAKHILDGNESITISCRLGYRSAVVLSDESIKDAMDSTETTNDSNERENKFEGDARVGMLFAGKEATEDIEAQPAVVLVHNLSKEYVLQSLRTSPLVQQYKLNDESKKKVQLISLAHNPETQMAAYLLSNHQAIDGETLAKRARDYMKQSMTSAFAGYETAVKEGLIDGYGVDSNGLSLPESHDMHFDWRDVLECAVDAYLEVHGESIESGRSSSLKVIRLPANILETRGLSVANGIHSFFGDSDGERSSSEEGLHSFADDESDPSVQQKRKLRKLRNLLPKSLGVIVTRPLTAYPYGGTGYGPSSTPASVPPLFLNGQQRNESVGSDGKLIDATHPIRLLDCQIELESGQHQDPPLIWTNEHYNQYGVRPAAYQPILNVALTHFDADEILEASCNRELTVEERETLDGCKILRDLIHDLDNSLDTMKSFAAYEEYLVKVVVPLIYGQFEELDEESSKVLQLFFKVHGMAVRMVISRWTRELLTGKGEDKQGGESISEIWQRFGFGEFTGGYDIAGNIPLQDFALEHILKDDAVRGLVVGCSRPEHVLEAMRAADTSADGVNADK